jgi:hypothetical protein
VIALPGNRRLVDAYAVQHPGTVCRCDVRPCGNSVMTLATIDCAVGPTNGGSPAGISDTTQPGE